MGCEGYITFAEIGEGQHLLSDDTLKYIIKPDEKVAVIPAYPTLFGNHWNFDHHAGDFANLFDYDSFNPRGGAYFAQGEPSIGVIMVDRTVFSQVFSEIWEEWEDSNRGPGAQPLNKLLDIWDRLTPGLWVVKRHHPSGTEGRGYYTLFPPEGCQVKKEVEWEFWT